MRGPACPAAHDHACGGTGKPIALHGTFGREYATGRGVYLAVRELLRAEHAGKIVGKEIVLLARRRTKPPVLSCRCAQACLCHGDRGMRCTGPCLTACAFQIVVPRLAQVLGWKHSTHASSCKERGWSLPVGPWVSHLDGRSTVALPT